MMTKNFTISIQTLALLLIAVATTFVHAEDAYAYDDAVSECETTVDHSFTCSQTSLCEGDDDAIYASTTLCYQIRSCFLGFCSTSDLTEFTAGSEEEDEVCGMLDQDVNDLCYEGWDSSWYMTMYVEALDCNDSSLVYLDCTETMGNVSSATAASMGFSAAGAAAVIAVLILRQRRRRRVTITNNHNVLPGEVPGDHTSFSNTELVDFDRF